MESFGIDFGTSTILLCGDNAGVPSIVSLSDERGKNFLPSSFVKRDSGWVFAPDRSSESSTQSLKAHITQCGDPGLNKSTEELVAELSEFRPALSEVFEHLARQAAPVANIKGAEVRIAAPVLWNKAQRQLLVDAARDAGYKRVSLGSVLEEPVAAAAEWLRKASSFEAGAQVVVFDCGGGTTDVAVLEAINVDGEVQVVVVGTKGIALGGDFADLILEQWYLETQSTRQSDASALLAIVTRALDQMQAYPDIPAALKALHEEVRRRVREAKELASRGIVAEISFVQPFEGLPSVSLSSEELGRILKPFVTKLVTFTEATVREANWRTRKLAPDEDVPSVVGARSQRANKTVTGRHVKPGALDSVTQVFLVGGMANLPVFLSQFEQKFPQSLVHVAEQPTETVVSGLAPRAPFNSFTVCNPGLDIFLVDGEGRDYQVYSMFTPLYEPWEMHLCNDYAGIQTEFMAAGDRVTAGRIEFRLPDGQKVPVSIEPLGDEKELLLGGGAKVKVKIYGNGNVLIVDAVGRDWHTRVPFWPAGFSGKAPKSVLLKEGKRPGLGGGTRYWED